MENFEHHFQTEEAQAMRVVLTAALDRAVPHSDPRWVGVEALVRVPAIQVWLETEPDLLLRAAKEMINAQSEEAAILGGVMSMYLSDADPTVALALFDQLYDRSTDLALEAATDLDQRVDELIESGDSRLDAFLEFRQLIDRKRPLA